MLAWHFGQGLQLALIQHLTSRARIVAGVRPAYGRDPALVVGVWVVWVVRGYDRCTHCRTISHHVRETAGAGHGRTGVPCFFVVFLVVIIAGVYADVYGVGRECIVTFIIENLCFGSCAGRNELRIKVQQFINS